MNVIQRPLQVASVLFDIMLDMEQRYILFRRWNINTGYVTSPVSETFDSRRQLVSRQLCGQYYELPVC